MLVLADRGFDGDEFLTAVAGIGAQLLVHATAIRRPPVGLLLAGGSHLPRIAGLTLHVIKAQVTAPTADGGTVTGSHWLIATPLDHRADPAPRLVAHYHEREEVESFYAPRHIPLRRRADRDIPGVIWRHGPDKTYKGMSIH